MFISPVHAILQIPTSRMNAFNQSTENIFCAQNITDIADVSWQNIIGQVSCTVYYGYFFITLACKHYKKMGPVHLFELKGEYTH